MKKSSSKKLAIWQSRDDNPCLLRLQTHALPTVIQNKTPVWNPKSVPQLTAKASAHLDTIQLSGAIFVV